MFHSGVLLFPLRSGFASPALIFDQRVLRHFCKSTQKLAGYCFQPAFYSYFYMLCLRSRIGIDLAEFINLRAGQRIAAVIFLAIRMTGHLDKLHLVLFDHDGHQPP